MSRAHREHRLHRALGDEAEAAVADLLQAQGLVVLDRNARFRFGELDLVMRDGDTTVFIEVRRRRAGRYGNGAVSVTWRKRRRIALAARAWLAERRVLANRPCRFDVASVRDEGRGLQVELWRDAFSLDDC